MRHKIGYHDRLTFTTNEKCKVNRYGIIDLFKDCERCDYKLLRYPLGEDADLGFALHKDNDIIIFVNTCSRLSREIFTLAHEIGRKVNLSRLKFILGIMQEYGKKQGLKEFFTFYKKWEVKVKKQSSYALVNLEMIV